MRKKHSTGMIVLALIVIGVIYAVVRVQSHAQSTQTGGSSQAQSVFNPSAPTKNAHCVAANGLPDPACTPGVILPAATKDQICVSGYSTTVRNVSTSEKDAVYAEYGITSHTTGAYEVDHLISLELGGSNDIGNLWPEAASPVPGFHQKDTFENTLHSEVCNGTITLALAQQEISTNWLQYYSAH
jgi:hypothetical protein